MPCAIAMALNCPLTHLKLQTRYIYFVVRGDNEWADKHTDELQSILLMTERCLATGDTLIIELLKGYSHDQLVVNEENSKKNWQVFDRTTGEEILDWEYIGNGKVIVNGTKEFHEYTVNFFATFCIGY